MFLLFLCRIMIPYSIQLLAANPYVEIRIFRNIRIDTQILRSQACNHLHRNDILPRGKQRILYKIAEQILVTMLLYSLRRSDEVIMGCPIAQYLYQL